MKHIDDLFKEELSGYTETPPPPAWDSLEKRLSDRRRRKFPYGWFWYVSVLSFMALLGASVLWKMNNLPTPAGFAQTNIPAAGTPKPYGQVAIASVNTAQADHIVNAPAGSAHSDKSMTHQHNPSLAKNTQGHKLARHISKSSTRTSVDKRGSDQSKITKAGKIQSDEYADEDDDQYTVGYNSNARNNNTSSDDNEKYESGYVVRESNHDHIYVAEMDPAPQASEAVYGSSSVTADETAAFQARNATIAAQTTVAQKAVSKHINAQMVSNKAQGTKMIAARNMGSDKLLAGTSSETGKHRISKATPRTSRVLQAAKPLINTSNEKQLAVLAGKHAQSQRSGIAKTSHVIASQSHVKPSTEANTTNVATSAVRKIDNMPLAAVSAKPAAKVKTNAAASKSALSVNEAQKELTPARKHHNPTKFANSLLKTEAVSANMKSAKGITETVADTRNIDKHTTKAKSIVGNVAASPVVKNKRINKQQATVVTTTKTKVTPINKQSVSIAKSSTAAVKSVMNKTPSVPVAATSIAKKAIAANNSVQLAAGSIRVKESAAQDKQVAKVEKNIAAPADNKATAKKENKAKTKTNGKRAAGASGSLATSALAQPQSYTNIYKYSFSGRTLADEIPVIDNLQVNSFTPQQLQPGAAVRSVSGTFKEDALKPSVADSAATNALASNDSAAKHKAFSKRFEAGIKSGVETGFSKGAANKFVLSPFLQFNLSDKFSLLTQPSVKISQLGNVNVGSPRSYLTTLSSSHSGVVDSGIVITYSNYGGNTVADPMELRAYNYTRTYDSMVKSYSLAHAYTEFELPLLVKFKFFKQLSVYGGVNMDYSKLINVEEQTYTSGPMVQEKTGVTLAALSAPAPAAPSASSVFPTGPVYNGPVYPSPKGDLLRIGYMLGFSYEYKKRWLFDVLVQQATAKPNYEGGANTNAPLELPYFRFTIGYKILK